MGYAVKLQKGDKFPPEIGIYHSGSGYSYTYLMTTTNGVRTLQYTLSSFGDNPAVRTGTYLKTVNAGGSTSPGVYIIKTSKYLIIPYTNGVIQPQTIQAGTKISGICAIALGID